MSSRRPRKRLPNPKLGLYEGKEIPALLHGRFEGRPEPWHPDQKETFDRMFQILDTNNLTHELSDLDWEVIDIISPDIPQPDINEEVSKYFSERRWGSKKRGNHE